ncbi:hypothetical protein H0H81_011193, partial [Sphagnurus paluster]
IHAALHLVDGAKSQDVENQSDDEDADVNMDLDVDEEVNANKGTKAKEKKTKKGLLLHEQINAINFTQVSLGSEAGKCQADSIDSKTKR